MTSAEQLADAIRREPARLHPARLRSRSRRVCRPASTAANALAAVDQVVECGCGSGALAGRCPECLAEQTEPMKVLAIRVQRVIERIRAMRTAERDARYEAWLAAHPPQPEQLTLADCHPLREEAS
jgi:hypothetical protein